MLNINVPPSELSESERDEIPGCDGYPCSRINAADRENKTQEEIER
jgi:hypothetical protein